MINCAGDSLDLGRRFGIFHYFKGFYPEVLMVRHLLYVSTIIFLLIFTGLAVLPGCKGDPNNAAIPSYVDQGQDRPVNTITSINVEPVGTNMTVGGLQQYQAFARYVDGTVEKVTDNVEWYTDSTVIGVFEPGGGRFLAQNPGVAVIRCRMLKGDGTYLVSAGAYANSYYPDADVPPAMVLNPEVQGVPAGVLVNWSQNVTDGDLAGYNVWRTQVSNAHYSTDFGRVNQAPIIFPPFIDKTVLAGWYYYRITAEDLLGLHSVPSKEVAIFVTSPGEAHYGNAYDGVQNSLQEQQYKDAFSTAF